MGIVKIRVNDTIVNVSVPKTNSIEERRERSKKIEKYRIFLTKLYKK